MPVAAGALFDLFTREVLLTKGSRTASLTAIHTLLFINYVFQQSS
jgi:hypothetical protein